MLAPIFPRSYGPRTNAKKNNKKNKKKQQQQQKNTHTNEPLPSPLPANLKQKANYPPTPPLPLFFPHPPTPTPPSFCYCYRSTPSPPRRPVLFLLHPLRPPHPTKIPHPTGVCVLEAAASLDSAQTSPFPRFPTRSLPRTLHIPIDMQAHPPPSPPPSPPHPIRANCALDNPHHPSPLSSLSLFG